MNYSQTAQSGNSYTHMWDVATTKVFDGGFLFDLASVPTGTEKLPKGVYLKLDQTERTAKLVKTAVLVDAVTADSEIVKIAKGALLVATDVLGNGSKAVTVGSVDTSNAGYDSFAIAKNALGVLSIGAVLQSSVEAGSSKSVINPDGFNDREVVLDAQPTVSAIYAVDGIVTSALPQGTTNAIKTALKFCQFLS